MRASLVVFLLLLLCAAGFAQAVIGLDPIGQRSQELRQTRGQLMTAVLQRDKSTALQLVQVLAEQDSTLWNSLKLYEKLRLWLWTEQFEQITAFCQTHPTRHDSLFQQLYLLPVHELDEVLEYAVRDEKPNIASQIRASRLSAADQEFLHLMLEFLTPRRVRLVGPDRSLTESTRDFVGRYPGHSLRSHAARNFIERWRPAQFQSIVSFTGGTPVLTGQLKDSFDPRFLFNLSLSYSIDKHQVFVTADLATIQARDSVRVQSGVWFPNATTDISVFQLGYGYHLIQNRNLEVTPFVSIGSTRLGFDEEVDDNEDQQNRDIEGSPHLGFGYAFSTGLLTDITLLEIVYRNIDADPSPNRLSLRLRYQYTQLNFSRFESQFNSDMHTISAGLLFKFSL